MNSEEVMAKLAEIESRLTRIESRLVQLMLHAGMDPYKKTYDGVER